MPMKPNKGESKNDFMSRCVADMMGPNKDKRPQDQAVAACLSIWNQSSGKQLTPDDGEARVDFIDRCITEGYDEIECQQMWAERSAPVMHKTLAADITNGMEFVLSDATPDRYGDVIEADGWDIENFSRNPIALFNHNANFPIGKWRNIRTAKGALRGHLEMAPEGTSARIDEIRKLVAAGILRAVSVGFRPIESKPRMSKDGRSSLGEIFTSQELVETSLVSVPANPNALAVAKSLNVSAETMDLVFAEHGNKNGVRTRSGHGEHARTTPNKGKNSMATIAERIKAAQERIVKLREQLDTHVKTMDDENPDDAALAMEEDLSQQIETQEKALASLQRAETRLKITVVADGGDQGVVERNADGAIIVRDARRPFALPAKKIAPADYVFRSLTVLVKQHFDKSKKPLDVILRETYGEDEATRAVMNVLTRAATAPATTTTVGWAAELVVTAIGEFLEALRPVSIYAGLAAKGGKFTFGRNGIVSLPARAPTPTVAGSFVLQGAPIPVRQAGFTAITLTPKKMAVISTFTREIAEHSTPAIEGLIRQAIIDDTAVAIDTVLLDNGAATAARPAGLVNGVTGLTATVGGGFAGFIGDLKSLAGALIAGTNGNIRQPVWLMSPADVLAAALTPTPAGGDLPFRDELARGTLMGYPVLQSTSVTPDTMFLIDAADFVTATGDDPRFDISDQATLHMEDTTPLALGTAGSPATVAAPMRSLWQTDTLGIRMILDMNWAMRRAGMVQFVTGLTWNA